MYRLIPVRKFLLLKVDFTIFAADHFGHNNILQMGDYFSDQEYAGADYSNAALPKGDYENCIFTHCNLSNCDLSGVNFIECEFEDCDFSMAKIANTAFREATFKSCKMLGLRFENCDRLLFSAGFEACHLNLSSFYQLKLKNTIFGNCSLKEVDFTETDLTNSTFSNCDFSGATFDHTILEKADLRTSYNFSIDPEKNRIKQAKFSLSSVAGLLDRYNIEIE